MLVGGRGAYSKQPGAADAVLKVGTLFREMQRG